jgi:bifunctional DNA-binding transcriptional regulator/antitoxin component of YhaV-PrlF toxin-antitoxin module
MTTILKTTSKGQITIPVAWRNKFNTNQFVATISDNKLELEPLLLDDYSQAKDYTVFDAIRDNQGKGIKAGDLVKILKQLKA